MFDSMINKKVEAFFRSKENTMFYPVCLYANTGDCKIGILLRPINKIPVFLMTHGENTVGRLDKVFLFSFFQIPQSGLFIGNFLEQAAAR